MTPDEPLTPKGMRNLRSPVPPRGARFGAYGFARLTAVIGVIGRQLSVPDSGVRRVAATVIRCLVFPFGQSLRLFGGVITKIGKQFAVPDSVLRRAALGAIVITIGASLRNDALLLAAVILGGGAFLEAQLSAYLRRQRIEKFLAEMHPEVVPTEVRIHAADHLQKCASDAIKIVTDSQNSTLQIENGRSGRLHFAGELIAFVGLLIPVVAGSLYLGLIRISPAVANHERGTVSAPLGSDHGRGAASIPEVPGPNQKVPNPSTAASGPITQPMSTSLVGPHAQQDQQPAYGLDALRRMSDGADQLSQRVVALASAVTDKLSRTSEHPGDTVQTASVAVSDWRILTFGLSMGVFFLSVSMACFRGSESRAKRAERLLHSIENYDRLRAALMLERAIEHARDACDTTVEKALVKVLLSQDAPVNSEKDAEEPRQTTVELNVPKGTATWSQVD